MANWSKPTGEPEDYLYADVGNGTQSTIDFSAYAPVTLNENEFYYIAATYNQSFLRLYLNGTEIAASSVNITDNVGDGNLHIGAHGIISMEPTQGIIDEVRIYNHALTQTEILADMLACVPERIEANVDIHPDIFVVQVKENRKPKEPKWAFLRTFLELPEGLSVDDIDVDTVTLSVNDTTLAMAEYDKVVDNVLFVLFPLDLTNVSNILGLEATRVRMRGKWIKVMVATDPGQPVDLIELTISGELVDNGESFTGEDAVRMILK